MVKGSKLGRSDYRYIEEAYKHYEFTKINNREFYALLELRNKVLIGRLLNLDNHFTANGYELFREPIGMDEHLDRMQPIFEIINKHIKNFNPILIRHDNDIKIEKILESNEDKDYSYILTMRVYKAELFLNLGMYVDNEHENTENIITIGNYSNSDIIFMDLLAKDLVRHSNISYEFDIPLYQLLDK